MLITINTKRRHRILLPFVHPSTFCQICPIVCFVPSAHQFLSFFSGYTMDSWQKWRIVCLSILSVEDVYIIGSLITEFLLFGVGGYLAYREIQNTSAAALAFVRLPGMYDGTCRAINSD
ncbi:hypothetical protein CRENBAI_000191 [Crenichthys baileyi]|uniref:Uncharacterized protein n=1 Tax=Crenichthys baileyi TaxID=28760 RepID=A0AAV9SRG8_9TELE